MGNVYAKGAKSSLKDLITQAEESEGRMSLMDELDLARAMTMDGVKMLDHLMEGDMAKLDPAIRARAASTVHNGVRLINDLVVSLKKLDLAEGMNLDAKAVDRIIDRVVQVIFTELEDQPDLAQKIVKKIQTIDVPRGSAAIVIG